MAAPPSPDVDNPYQEGSLIFTMTTPPEHASKLTPRWKGPFRVRRIPNHYQVVYEDGPVWRTVHFNHTKPAKFTAPDLPAPTPAPEPPRPALGYLPAGFLGSGPRRPPPSPPAAAPAEGRSLSLPQHQYPLRDPPRLPRARCLLPLPRRPTRIQNPLAVHGDLLDSTLSMTGCAL